MTKLFKSQTVLCIFGDFCQQLENLLGLRLSLKPLFITRICLREIAGPLHANAELLYTTTDQRMQRDSHGPIEADFVHSDTDI